MKVLQLLGLHLWLAACLYGCAATLWGNLAEKTYHSRMKAQRWLMPGRLAEKAYWTRFQKILAIAMLPVVLLVYVGAWLQLLK